MGESSVRFNRKKAFATLYREVAQDVRLSLESRGLLLLMASLPDNWEYSVAGLAKKAGCGRDKLRRILGELENVGYLTREQSHDKGGRFSGNVYVVQDDAPPLPGNPSTVKPSTGNTLPENPTENNKEEKVDYRKEPPKAPQRGNRTSKYDLAEDAKPVLRAYCTNYPELLHPLADLIEIRIARKAINSKRAIVTLLNEIDRLSGGRREDKLLLVRQSVANSWKSVFPLKGAGACQGAPDTPYPTPERIVEEEGTYLL